MPKIVDNIYTYILLFHPECQCQVSPLDPLDLQLLTHPREGTTDVLLVEMGLILEQTDVLYVDLVVGELDYLLSRGSIFSWQPWQTRHTR